MIFPEASEKLLHTSTCLGFNRRLLKGVCQSWIKSSETLASLKNKFCVFLENAVIDGSFIDLFKEFIKSIPKDSLIDKDYFSICFLFYSFNAKERSRLYLIEKFFKSKSEYIAHEDQRQLLIKLIKEDGIIDFQKFIEDETILSLHDFIVSSLEDSSEISRMSKYLQETASKPENNKLIQFLDKIPVGLLND